MAGLVGVVFLFLAGVGLLFFPVISQWLSKMDQTVAIRNFSNSVVRFSEEDKERWLNEARDYNEKLWSFFSKMGTDPETDEALLSELDEVYWGMLDPEKNGIMGTVSIPHLSIFLPIYHGTDETTLRRGAGHLQNTSLPVGGIHTHAVISAHTGYPRASMFDRLTELKEGDLFYVTTMEQRLAYRVSSIQIVSPYDLTGLMIQEEKDLCTLVTCYPYGINSHRLLITGERETSIAEEEGVEMPMKSPEIPWPLFLAAAVPTLILVLWMIRKRKRKLKWKKPSLGG